MDILQRFAPYLSGGLFLLFLAGYALYSTYAAHHLNEFGYSGDASQRMLRAYAGVTAVVIIGTVATILIGLFTL